jgi:radical SAM superfamily enzyme YgiQ (UPF0313 family)
MKSDQQGNGMKIKFIETTRYVSEGRLLKTKHLYYPSITFPLLASYTPPEYEIMMTNEIFEEIDFEEKVDLVGITSITSNIFRAYEVADEFRKRSVPVVMGGVHVSAEPDEALEHSDTVFIGEAERTWPQFLKDFDRGEQKRIYKSEDRTSMEGLPLPRFSLLDKYGSRYLGAQKKGVFKFISEPVFPIQTARGCPHSCDFCAVTGHFGPTYRPRPVRDVVDEIKALGARRIFFIDDDIMAVPKRAKELFKALMPLKILWGGQANISAAEDRKLLELARASGGVWVVIGLETLSEKNLRLIGKERLNKIERYAQNLKAYRKAGIDADVMMIFGFDEDSPEVFRKSYEFLVKNRVPYTGWLPLTPFPGTALYQKMKDNKRLKEDRWWLNPYGDAYALRYTGIAFDEKMFKKLFMFYYKKFYSPWSMMRRLFFPPTLRTPLTLYINSKYYKKISPETLIVEH